MPEHKFVIYKGIHYRFTKKAKKGAWQSQDIIKNSMLPDLLDPKSFNVEFVYVNRSQSNSAILHFSPVKKSLNIYFISKAKTDLKNLPNLKNILDNYQNSLKSLDQERICTEEMEFNYANSKDLETCLGHIDTKIVSSIKEDKVSTLVCVQTNKSNFLL